MASPCIWIWVFAVFWFESNPQFSQGCSMLMMASPWDQSATCWTAWCSRGGGAQSGEGWKHGEIFKIKTWNERLKKVYNIEEKKLKITKVQHVFLEVKIRRGYQTFEALAYLENSDGWMFSPSGMSPLSPFSRQPQGPLPRGKLMKRLFHSFKFSSPFKALHLCILSLTWHPFVLVVWFPKISFLQFFFLICLCFQKNNFKTVGI